MSRYHIETERNTAGHFVGWSVHNAQHPPLSRIYPLYEMAESEAMRLETESNGQEAAATPSQSTIAPLLHRR
ncbi:hypothetical protein C2134_15765 [Chromobacterium sinusclupearum]|uniref:Uncharacterized protein n=1 Tax=Chromobacterium sinusclupearum TaxID=2077146 RepID=A0A2K4MJQ1_9NEIS|nr:hypothetical protein [Chromobacterium sinusclupearum]POA97301.1 hypothetical protein C2134_15765 [Chromobacterium sinusclupearum]